MKRILIFATILLAAFACTKEANVNDTVQNTKESKDVYVINASVAPLVSEEGTKAAISEADGTFSWATGDAIAVTSSVTNKIYKFVYDGTSFVLDSSETMEESPVFSTAVFPYSEAGTLSYPTSLTSGTAALLAEGVRLSGTFTDNSTLTFQHAYSLLHVRFANAPSFTGAIKFEGTKSVTVSVTPDADNNADAYIPVDASETAFTLSLIDNSNNVIMKKSTNGKSFAIGTLKTMKPLTVGRIITFNNEAGWNAPRVSIWNGANNYGFKSTEAENGAEYPWKLNALGSNKYYIVINDDVVNSNAHIFANDDYVGVWFGNDESGSQTDRVFLDRDLSFTIPTGGGMKTQYRIYAKCLAGTPESMKIYAYQNWDSNDVLSDVWPGSEMTKSTLLENYFYWEWPQSIYSWKNIGIIFYNPSTSKQAEDKNHIVDTTIEFNRDIVVNFDDFKESGTTASFTVE